jgi:hypothetical protein
MGLPKLQRTKQGFEAQWGECLPAAGSCPSYFVSCRHIAAIAASCQLQLPVR